MSYSRHFGNAHVYPIYKADTNLEYMKALAQQPGKPFLAEAHHILLSPPTDIDHFPYTRYYRGEHLSDLPIAHTRQAGYRELKNSLYVSPNPEDSCSSYLNPKKEFESAIPFTSTLFEGGCTRTLPSYHPDNRNQNFTLGYKSHFGNISSQNR